MKEYGYNKYLGFNAADNILIVNRLLAANTNGFISSYWYDASGERVIKASGDDEGIYVNGLFSGACTETSNFTAYINPYLVVSKSGNYTKHIYVGSQRIVSKLGDLDSYGQDPRRIPYAGADVEGADVDYAEKYKESQQTIKDRYGDFEVPYYGKDNDDYVNGGGFCCDDNPKLRAGAIGNGNDNPEIYQYYYHSDHLGSTSLITDLDGEVVQHVEYVPFGEVFIEERNNRWNTPYLFNAKELDEETGLYYYGARYLDSRSSVFLGVDPMWEKYPGVSVFAYCHNSPLNYIDPTGMDDYYNEGGDYIGRDTKKTDNIIRIIDNLSEQISELNKSSGKLTPELLEKFKSKSLDKADLSAKAYSNIFTDILSKMEDVDMKELFNGKVSVALFDGNNSDNKLKENYNTNITSYDETASHQGISGKSLVTASILKGGEESNIHLYSTVSNVQNLLGAHEFLGHGMAGASDRKHTHYQAYEIQMAHPSWKTTTPEYKDYVQKISQQYFKPVKR